MNLDINTVLTTLAGVLLTVTAYLLKRVYERLEGKVDSLGKEQGRHGNRLTRLETALGLEPPEILNRREGDV